MFPRWKELSTLTLLFSSMSCFGGEATLYNEKGVTFSYKYEKIASSVDGACPDIEFDEYRVSAKVENSNGKAIDAAPGVAGGISSGKLAFNSYYCASGALQSNQTLYGDGVFMLHRSYGAKNINNPNFGVVISYFLDANDQYVTSNYDRGFANMKIPKGTPFPKPVSWNFPKWVFIDVPQRSGSAKAEQSAKRPTSDYASLIVGKWCRIRLQNSSGVDMKDRCSLNDWMEVTSSGKWVNGSGNRSDVNDNNQWSIVDSVVHRKTPYGSGEKQILELDKSKLILKTESKDGWWAIETFNKIK